MAESDSLAGAIAPLLDERFAVQLHHRDTATARTALAGLRADLAELPARAGATAVRVSVIAPMPAGPLFTIGDLAVRSSTAQVVATQIRRAVESAGIDVAAVEIHPVGGLADLDTCPNAAVLRLFPSPEGRAGRIDPRWIEVAAEWVFGDLGADAQVALRVLGVAVETGAAEAAGILHGCAQARAWCDVVSGSTTSRVRTASLTFGDVPHLAIAAGGPACDDAGLVARHELLCDVAAEFAGSVAYACVDFEETFDGLGLGLADDGWAARGGARANRVAGRLCDERVPDIYPFQILGDPHLARLGIEAGHGLAGRALGGGRHAVAVAEPIDWLPAHGLRGDLRSDAWSAYAPLLVGADDFDSLTDASPTDADSGSDGTFGLPPIADVRIVRHPTARRGTQLTALELAAWIDGDDHTDAPQAIEPTLAGFVRLLGSGIEDEPRQGLRNVAAALVGSVDRVDPTTVAWHTTDWLVRTNATTWLRASGLGESADRLAELPTIGETTALVRAVELLAAAVVTATRRLEIARSMVGPAEDVLDDLVWETWERAAEQCGWVAASEVGTTGVPTDLTFATDQRVIDIARDPRSRAAVEQSKRTLGDATWSAALHELATMAWRSAWAAAEAYVHHEVGFSLQVAVRRSLETAPGFDGDPVAVELAIDDAERAAIDAIARLALAGHSGDDAWVTAIDATATTDDSRAWRAAVDDARSVVGESVFDDAVDAARDELRRWLTLAPDLVARTVACAVAREAAGAAARSLIAQAAAPVLGRGADLDVANRAARAEVDGITDDLARSAVALVARLADPASGATPA